MEVAGCKLRFHQSPPTTLQNATRNPVAFLFYRGAFPPPFGALATQLYIVYYFFIFNFIYIRYAYTHGHTPKEVATKVAGCGLRFSFYKAEGGTPRKGATARNFATATAQPCTPLIEIKLTTEYTESHRVFQPTYAVTQSVAKSLRSIHVHVLEIFCL